MNYHLIFETYIDFLCSSFLLKRKLESCLGRKFKNLN